jgi:hypothetical protein
MANSKKPEANPSRRIENVLAFMAVGVIGLSILIIGFLLFAYATNIRSLPVLLPLIPFIGLPIGMLLIITLVIVSVRRRNREAK